MDNRMEDPSVQVSSVQLLRRVQLFATPWIAACQTSLSITNSQSVLKIMSIKSGIPSNHLILCCPLLLLSPISPSIRVFSSESTLHMRWPKYWSFSFSISPSNEYPGLIPILKHVNYGLEVTCSWSQTRGGMGCFQSLDWVPPCYISFSSCNGLRRLSKSHLKSTNSKGPKGWIGFRDLK